MSIAQYYLTAVSFAIGIGTGILGAMAAHFFAQLKQEWLSMPGSIASVIASLEAGKYMCTLLPIKAEFVHYHQWIFWTMWFGWLIIALVILDGRKQAQDPERERSSDGGH